MCVVSVLFFHVHLLYFYGLYLVFLGGNVFLEQIHYCNAITIIKPVSFVVKYNIC